MPYNKCVDMYFYVKKYKIINIGGGNMNKLKSVLVGVIAVSMIAVILATGGFAVGLSRPENEWDLLVDFRSRKVTPPFVRQKEASTNH